MCTDKHGGASVPVPGSRYMQMHWQSSSIDVQAVGRRLTGTSANLCLKSLNVAVQLSVIVFFTAHAVLQHVPA